MTPWSRICISHADCVLLVGAEEASPQVLPPHHRTAGDGSCLPVAGKAGLPLLLSSIVGCLLSLHIKHCICG